MKKRNIFLMVFFIAITSCINKNAFEIEGQFDNTNGQILYFSRMTSNGLEAIDSTVLDEGGKFDFVGETGIADFYAIYTTQENSITLLISPGQKIRINGDVKEFSGTYTVQGSKDSELVRDLSYRLNSNLKKIYGLGKIYQDSIHSANIENIKKELDANYEKIVEDQRNYSVLFIEENTNSLASLMALYQQISRGISVLNPIDDLKYYEMVEVELNKLYPESEAVKLLSSQVIEAKIKIKEAKDAELKTGIGVLAPDIALPSPEGDTILLSSLRGKYVLLDFWASWCTPCRVGNPNLVKNYHKFKNKGFEIYQVSLDRKRDAWLNAIEMDQLEWVHVSDLQFWNSIGARLYNVRLIPTNFLIDKKGVIIAKDLEGERLGEKLTEILN